MSTGPIDYTTATKSENKMVEMIDALRICEKDIDKLRKLVEKKKFVNDLELQSQAGLLCRGINIKLMALQAAEKCREGNLDGLTKAIAYLYAQFADAFKKIQIDVDVSGKLDTGSDLPPEERKALKEMAKAWAKRERQRKGATE